MVYNFRLLFSGLRRTFWRTKGTHARLTAKRVLAILIVVPVYVTIETFNWLGFLLDEVLFPGYRRQVVREPVFIVGVWRSGTTFLHRLMAQDADQFTSMRMWEVIFAPSIIQKKAFRLLGVLDRACGNPLTRLAMKLESRLFSSIGSFHQYSIFAADEDEFLLLHRCSSLLLIAMFPFTELFRPYVYFDSELDAREKEAYLRFYWRCVQKHLYAFGGNRRFLSKNPSFSGMIDGLNGIFPDARFVCMVRPPDEGVPSALSMWTSFLSLLLSPLNGLPLLDELRGTITHYYRYPIARLAAMKPERWQVVRYGDLVKRPARTVASIYQHLGFVMTPAYARALQCAEEQACRYESSHVYALDRFGLTHAGLRKEFADIYEQFGFGGQAGGAS